MIIKHNINKKVSNLDKRIADIIINSWYFKNEYF